jgi:ADP-heptose:LPS heptosyltransferase
MIRRIVLLLIRLYGAAGVRAASQGVHVSTVQAPRVLLLHPGPLGALILTTPVLHALKTQIPGAHITMMVGPWAGEVVAHHPDIDHLVVYPFPSYRRISPQGLRSYISLFRLARRLKRGRYDLALTLHRNFWWGAVLIYLTCIPRRVGYAVAPGTSFLTHSLPFQQHEHVTISRLAALSVGLQALGYAPLPDPYTPEHYLLQVESTAEEEEWVTLHLRAEGIDEVASLVAIHPGTSVAVKQWRAEAWANCVTALSTCWSGRNVHFLLTGTERELPLLQEIVRGTSARTTLLTEATVGQLAALLECCQLVLGVDSGPLHLAAAQHTPTLRIFGPTDPRRYSAWDCSERHVVVTSNDRCAGCQAIPCGRLHFHPHEIASHACVQRVPEQQVLDAIARHFPSLLDGAPGSTDYSPDSGEDDSILREELSQR